MSGFKKATRRKAKARVALVGPSGSGKTFTALRLARGIVGAEGRIAVIDTERGSASKYADDVETFDALDLDQHSPAEYVKAIRDAAAERYDVLVIDSLSHAWNGRGGALEQVDNAAKRSGGNSFAAWRDVTPQHNQLVDAILAYPGHVIVTMRSKTEYVVEQGKNGKTAPRKVGLAPIQRDGMEYEFDVFAELDLDHNLIVSKSRCRALDGAVVANPGYDVAEVLRAWLDGGEDAPAPKPAADPQAFANALGGQTTQPSPVDEAIDIDLGFVEDDATFIAWWERIMGLDPEGKHKRRVWDAALKRGAILNMSDRDIRPLIDTAKSNIASKQAA